MLTSKPGKVLSPRHTEIQQTSSLSPREAPPVPGHPKAKKTRSLSRSYSVKDLTEDDTDMSSELSIDDRLPGVLKIFGESVLPGAEYKSVLASTRSTSQELVKQALERYGQPPGHYVEYVLCDVIGLVETATPSYSQRPSNKWRTVCRRVLDDSDKPLELQSYWKPSNGFSRRYELHKRAEVVREQSADDTLGLNDNARKIMMAKVAPGAIPLSASWNMETSQFRIHSHDVKSIQRETMSDDSGATSSDVRPTQNPYLLTLRGYDTLRDQVQYQLKSKCTKIGRFRGHPYSSEIGLGGPDILPLHCVLTLKNTKDMGSVHTDNRYCFFIEMEVFEGALVAVNGHPISDMAHIYAGDVITIGRYYMFLYKDPSGGHDIPESLSWFNSSATHHDTTKLMSSRDRGPLNDFLNSSLGASGDFSASFDAGEGGASANEGHQITFAYCKEKEEDLVKAILDVHSCSRRDHPLTPAVMFVACLDHAHRKFTRHHLKNLQRRVLFCVREKVADLAKTLSSQRYDSSVFDYGSPTTDYDPLKLLIFWMSNTVQLYVHVLHELHAHSVNPDPEDEVNAGLQELATGLEDVVSFSFQQTVYCVTKILYHVVGKVMDSNPFSGSETWEKDGIGHVLSVLQTTRNIASEVRLHNDVMRQLMTYLLFFLSTSLFNRLITTESDAQYYNWTFGVRLQANLSRLEEWSASKQLDRQFHQVSQPLTAAADVLAMSKNILVRMDWPAFRTQFSSLNESQLLKLLRGYQLGMKKAAPSHWFPPEGGVSNPRDEDLPIKLSSHPAFALPKEGCPLDLTQTFPEGFLEYLEHFQTVYGAEDDDSDSGLSVSNTPRVPEARPRDSKTFFNIDSPRGSHQHEPQQADRVPPVRPTRSSSNVRSSTTNRNQGQQWRTRSQERPPLPSNRSRSNGDYRVQGNNNATDFPISKRKTITRVPPLDLFRDGDVSSNTSTAPYNKTKSRSTDSLLQGISTDSCDTVRQKSICKSPRSAGPSVRVGRTGVNYDDVSKFPEDVYVEVQRFDSRNNNVAQTLKVLSLEDPTNVGAKQHTPGAYNSLSPRNRRSLPYDEVFLQDIPGDVVTVELDKGDSQLGLGLIDGLYTPLKCPGIYVKNLLQGSPAHHCGQLSIGDRILAINDHNIACQDYQSVMTLFRTSGPRLQVVVVKSEQAVVDMISAAKC
ncbi:ras-associating and dilute domain-containing protein-like isoform X1 [Haliotis rufescens]|uniref:ras-associating and dilute domain-containing protein-like isoform X1 n=1 Tax=Haliotis rufescens TaxID=6454 RepID=UPI00201F0401|nr:ras-associating and dilute domain-containing protein-like isoform X1 [Haliotis rufescens]XP_048248066.1 ras-associating and dilute domain-containing protein-like isoform X1 [Haliotis rufescens]